jgi:hypothetical protein
MTLQDGGPGILAIADFGLGENFSIDVLTSYLLGGTNINDVNAEYRLMPKPDSMLIWEA